MSKVIFFPIGNMKKLIASSVTCDPAQVKQQQLQLSPWPSHRLHLCWMDDLAESDQTCEGSRKLCCDSHDPSRTALWMHCAVFSMGTVISHAAAACCWELPWGRCFFIKGGIKL